MLSGEICRMEQGRAYRGGLRVAMAGGHHSDQTSVVVVTNGGRGSK